jgi:hypothetical protein
MNYATPATDKDIATNEGDFDCDCRASDPYDPAPWHRPDCAYLVGPRLIARIKADAEKIRLLTEASVIADLIIEDSDATRTIRDLRNQVKRCHGIMQGLVSAIDPEGIDDDILLDATKELNGEFCPGACTTSCDAERDALKAALAEKLESMIRIAESHAHHAATVAVKLAEVEKDRDRLKAALAAMNAATQRAEEQHLA